MTSAEQIAAIEARKLGRVQKSVILSLGEDWGPACNHQAAKRLWYREHRTVEHKHCEDNVWCLTPLGLEVRAILNQENRDAE